MMKQNIKTLVQKLRDDEYKKHQLYLANFYKAKKYFEQYKSTMFKRMREEELLTG